MTNSTTKDVTVRGGCSFFAVLLLTVALLVLQYTVAPSLPWWLVWGPAMLYGGFAALVLGFFLFIFIVACIITLCVQINEQMKKKRGR